MEQEDRLRGHVGLVLPQVSRLIIQVGTVSTKPVSAVWGASTSGSYEEVSGWHYLCVVLRIEIGYKQCLAKIFIVGKQQLRGKADFHSYRCKKNNKIK